MERGPIYGVELRTDMPFVKGSMRQALPSRHDLEQVVDVNMRVAAGYETTLAHMQTLLRLVRECRRCQLDGMDALASSEWDNLVEYAEIIDEEVQ